MNSHARRNLFKRLWTILNHRDEQGELDVEVYWKKIPGYYGQMYHIIHLDPDGDLAESTLLHETLHILFPEAEEKEIQRLENDLFNGLNESELRKLKNFLKGVDYGPS